MSTDIWLGWTYFILCALFALVGALATISSANPIRGAMGLLMMILSIAGLYLSLHAQFLAAIQLIVYAGAIVVLFLFVIMLLGPSAQAPSDSRARFPRAIGAGLFLLLGAGVVSWLVMLGQHISKETARLAAAGTWKPATVPSDFGGIDAFGKELFTKTLVPFELSSALLLVAVIGAIAVARSKHGDGAEKALPTAAALTEATPKEEASV